MAYYLVSAKPKPARLGTLRGKLRQHAFEELFPFGETMTFSLENARLREDGYATWEEEDDRTPPLVQERKVALDEFFEDLSLTPVQEGAGWEKIARLPWLFPEFTSDTIRSPYALGFTTLTTEIDVPALPVRGELPLWLTGTLVRTGPARFEVGRQKLRHWFDGLAMLHRFTFAGGRVSYANRFLRSQSYQEAMAKGEICRGEFATDPCRTLFQRVVSWFSPRITDNGAVNVTQWADALLALTETRLPVRFDAESLATLGLSEYDRRIQGPVATAHPHFDARRGVHYSHTLDFGRRSVYRFFEAAEASGRQSILSNLETERPAYVHSFGMTQHYLILAECPFVVDPLRLRFSDKPFIQNYEWEPERRTRFRLIEKGSGRLVRTATGAPFFAFHHLNAFEAGEDVVFDVVTHPDPAIIDRLYLDRLRSAAPVSATGRLTRFRFGTGNNVPSEQLADLPIELPRFDYGRRAGRRHRYVYGAGNEIPGNFIDSLVKLDLDDGASRTWHKAGCYPGEPVFVPRPGSVEEDDGVILSLVLDTRKATSFLLALDAATFRDLARAEAPHHIPFGLHGQFLQDRNGT